MFNIDIIDIVVALATGVVSGVVSSVCFYYIMKNVKPKLAVSPYVCISDSVGMGDDLCYIKFVNFSRKVITRLDYVLQYVIMGGDSVHEVKEIAPCKPKLKLIDKYDPHDNDAKYAVRISYRIPSSEYPMTDNARLLFTVLAEDPSSGTTTCVKKEFKACDLVHGEHQTRESLEYVATNRPRTLV